jgi:hypothetical protein
LYPSRLSWGEGEGQEEEEVVFYGPHIRKALFKKFLSAERDILMKNFVRLSL